ncbi:MAG: hypothetical protein A2W91_09660 [Bacteroidetes bacterium GWF2_38_335]|nr:MAG: hypothetical protein A2W91_09660 [Bacteroidetes bacterium GWF2_38_335]OFY78856.1 MAG: hypothetical protein A2281_13995 [Bacteroidetes bacterium RIFOXYA12_FULL_38_20]HBS86300.1 hypothetical protein [Bacteroidales bacterium]
MNSKHEQAISEVTMEDNVKDTKEKMAMATLALHLSSDQNGINEKIAACALSLHLNSGCSQNEEIALAALAMYLENSGRKITSEEMAVMALTIFLGKEEFEKSQVLFNRPAGIQVSQWNSKPFMMRQVPQRIPGYHPYSNYKRF